MEKTQDLEATQDLYNYHTGEVIRPATADEIAASDEAASKDGGVGAFAGPDDVTCYTA